MQKDYCSVGSTKSPAYPKVNAWSEILDSFSGRSTNHSYIATNLSLLDRFASSRVAIQAASCQHWYLESQRATKANIYSPSACFVGGPNARNMRPDILTTSLESSTVDTYFIVLGHTLLLSALSCPQPVLASGATGRQRDSNLSRPRHHLAMNPIARDKEVPEG